MLAIGDVVGAGPGEVVEGALGDADDVALDELGALARTVLRMLERAFPLQNRPAVVVIGRVSLENMAPKSTCPSPSERKRLGRG